MDNGHDRETNGSGFIAGLLTGTVLGAGLGLLFAPKRGSELRSQISDTASGAGRAASEQYRRASELAGNAADKGRRFYGKARHVVSRSAAGARDIVGQVKDRATEAMHGSETPAATTPGAPHSVP